MNNHLLKYLALHPEVINQVNSGELCLIGLSDEEQKAILDAINNGNIDDSSLGYWE